MKKARIVDLEESGDHLDTVYSKEDLMKLLENDEISPEEEGFMFGYDSY